MEMLWDPETVFRRIDGSQVTFSQLSGKRVIDDTSSVLADICLQLLESVKMETGSSYGDGVLDARTKAVKGLVELVRGDLESSDSFFQGLKENKGNVAISYGGFLHAKQNFPMAKEIYEKVIQGVSETKDSSDPHNLAADEMLTQALTKTEEHFGSRHPKVGVVLTCIALMFRHKAATERSSSILIQEGLYRRALEMLKAPSLETTDMGKVHRRDIVALARGGYAELLCVQQNRKAEGEKMKKWAETAWGNRRLSVADALTLSEPSSKVPVVDLRISRVL
ncbi:hypothetical protein POM88_024168 [Heracleum sosnowskyi]|uniref:Tetratricopeptide repeat (TPR)-like superfamily protein n=1 Tax=Heracleum sosnowskyi TaxID=360622 RepID=A0AAD8I1H3_9APIA|nr:hypothetical protein POM88_024168 [Heracleum sosnowskyi]